jgi:hypothetical protein
LTAEQVRLLQARYGPLEDRVNWWVRFGHLFWFAAALLLGAWWCLRNTRPSPQLERTVKVQRFLEQEAYRMAFLAYRCELQKGSSEPEAFLVGVSHLSGQKITPLQATQNLRLLIDVMRGTPPRTAPVIGSAMQRPAAEARPEPHTPHFADGGKPATQALSE